LDSEASLNPGDTIVIPDGEGVVKISAAPNKLLKRILTEEEAVRRSSDIT